MPVKTVLGLNCKLYRNTGTYGSPTWDLIPNVGDLTISLEKSEADCSTRESAWKAVKGAMIEAGVDFKMVFDSGDTDVTTLRSAFIAGTAIEFAMLDELVATTGATGFRMTCEVVKFSVDEELNGVRMVNVSIKPTRADNAPSVHTT